MGLATTTAFLAGMVGLGSSAAVTGGVATAGVAAAAGAGATFASIAAPIALGVGASQLMSGSTKQQGSTSPVALPQPPSMEASAEKASDVIRRKASGASQSVYTSPLGIAGTADVARKTLLGQ